MKCWLRGEIWENRSTINIGKNFKKGWEQRRETTNSTEEVIYNVSMVAYYYKLA